MIDGQKRASIVIDPPDGRVPPMTPAGAAAASRAASGRRRISRRARTTRASRAPAPTTIPSAVRSASAACSGFGSTSGPPVLPNYFYNNLHQIVQTPDTVMILTEMVHDARIVRMNAQHLPQTIRKWMGDSVGRWEGDTLVVDTTNFTGQDAVPRVDRRTCTSSSGSRASMRRRCCTGSRSRIPTPGRRPWTGEYTWPATDEQHLRVRVPRRQLRAGQHPARRAADRKHDAKKSRT